VQIIRVLKVYDIFYVVLNIEIPTVVSNKYLSIRRSTFALTFGTTQLIECYTMHHNSLHVTFLNCPTGPSGNSPRFFAQFSAMVPQDRRPTPPLRSRRTHASENRDYDRMEWYFLKNQLVLEHATNYLSHFNFF